MPRSYVAQLFGSAIFSFLGNLVLISIVTTHLHSCWQYVRIPLSLHILAITGYQFLSSLFAVVVF